MITYPDKFFKLLPQTSFNLLSDGDKTFIQTKSFDLLLTFQEVKKLIDICLDLQMWQSGKIDTLWPDEAQFNHLKDTQRKKAIVNNITNNWASIRQQKKDYTHFDGHSERVQPEFTVIPTPENSSDTIMGTCPVASEKTLCCNLQTLDAIQNCGLDCSYCSIQSFFKNDQVLIEANLSQKLNKIQLDPSKTYHIGTGQSSDSLFLGNSHKILTSLLTFAEENPNVILEFKTKSKNIAPLLNNSVPKNVICTWSLNTNTIIKNEEHFTASLQERIKSARKVADQKILVGFHLHPIVYYHNYQQEYSELIDLIMQNFSPSEVALVSLGTLTFTKPVMNKIRKRDIKSKILQMSLVETDGKFSYPGDIKIEMFKHIYQKFKEWHSDVFFYLCMENIDLWEPTLNHHYSNNSSFETAMLSSYSQKILSLKNSNSSSR